MDDKGNDLRQDGSKYVRVYTSEWENTDTRATHDEPEDAWYDDTVCDPIPDDDYTAVDGAVDVIELHGLTEPSCMPGFTLDLWYSDPNGGYTFSYRTGQYRELSAHLYGFNESEQREIWTRVTGQSS